MCPTRRTDADDFTALDVALLTGNAEISKLLRTHGARTRLASKLINFVFVRL